MKSSQMEGTDLNRFVVAQEQVFEQALAEVKLGKKHSHWMWFVFPQFKGLGKTETARFYGIESLNEASEFLNHPLLGPRLIAIASALLDVEGKSAYEIFNSPDDIKLRSSMTLFSKVGFAPEVFKRVIDKYFDGIPDSRTVELLQNEV